MKILPLLIIFFFWSIASSGSVFINKVKFKIKDVVPQKKRIICGRSEKNVERVIAIEESEGGGIEHNKKKYKIVMVRTIDHGKQEDIFDAVENADFAGTKTRHHILYTKKRQYPISASGYFIEEKLEFIVFYRIKPDIPRFTMSGYKNPEYFFRETDIFGFSETGKLIEIEFNKPDYIFVYKNGNKYECNTVHNRFNFSQEMLNRNHEVRDLKKIAEYLKSHEQVITYTEPVNGHLVKTMEMKFDKDSELKELFMRKVDFMDGTIGDSITIGFEKGKKISEIRGK
ncbi:MAG: hypothetical protein LBQ97_01745 [Fusobacteriaceae bacterium]|jgi:hypothetical protein|nr:hypothetical protein [Fusobacteriaceae bacterium]